MTPGELAKMTPAEVARLEHAGRANEDEWESAEESSDVETSSSID